LPLQPAATAPQARDHSESLLHWRPLNASDVGHPGPRGPSPFAAGRAALRRFWRPFLLIQAAAVLLVVAYHLSAAVRAACDAAASAKTRGGLPFAAVTGAVAGGLLPELAKRLADPKAHQPEGRGSAIAFNTAFFAVNGVVIDRFYRFEGHLFGQAASPAIVAAKTAFDQFVFTPIWLLVIVALFTWRQNAFSGRVMLPLLRDRFYRRRVLPLLIPNWCFWIPMVSIIYALPAALQFLLFVLVLAAWSLIMVFIAEG
jgi:hypothetical protein